MKLSHKMRLGWSCVRYWIARQSAPVAIAWLVTGRCNMHCTYCMWKHLRTGEELDTAQAHELIDQMRAAGVVLVSFTGGEPLMRDDMGELIRHAQARGMVAKLNTNGVLVESRLDELRSLDLLQISIDGAPSVHEPLRGEGSYSTALGALRTARDAGIPIQLTACLSRVSVGRIGEILDWALSQSVALCFQVLSRNFLDPEDLEAAVPDPEALAGALRQLLALKQSRDPRARAIGSSTGELRYLLDRVERPRGFCDGAPVSATVLPDGKLIFCANARTHESFDTREIGFAEAFSRLTVPECEGCECIGRLRTSRVYDLDPSVIREVLRL